VPGDAGVSHWLARWGHRPRPRRRRQFEAVIRSLPGIPPNSVPSGAQHGRGHAALWKPGPGRPSPPERLPASWMARPAGPELASLPDPPQPRFHGVGRGAHPGWRMGVVARGSCPCATGRRLVGRSPRSGRVEIRLGPAWVRYRGTATPETDPPSVVHRPVLVAGRHRARSPRLRVTLPRYQPCSWWPLAAMPAAPMSPAGLLLLDLQSYVAVPARPGACSGTPACAPLGPAVLHRVAG
jgi:hypothetical protein